MQEVECFSSPLKLLDDKIGENLDDPEYSHGFLDTTPKA